MCNFFSAVATKDKLHAYYGIDGHEDIITISNLEHLDKKSYDIQLVRLELLPDSPMTLDFTKWKFKVDQQVVPNWFIPDEWHERMIEFLRNVPSIIDEHVKILSSECWFCTGKIDRIVGRGSIEHMLSDSQVNIMLDSSQVNIMHGDSRIVKMWNNSQVGMMRDDSEVGSVWDTSRINIMWDNSQVNRTTSNSQVNQMFDNSKIVGMMGSSQVNIMFNNSQINEMRNNSRIGVMRGNSQIKIDFRDKKTNQ